MTDRANDLIRTLIPERDQGRAIILYETVTDMVEGEINPRDFICQFRYMVEKQSATKAFVGAMLGTGAVLFFLFFVLEYYLKQAASHLVIVAIVAGLLALCAVVYRIVERFIDRKYTKELIDTSLLLARGIDQQKRGPI